MDKEMSYMRYEIKSKSPRNQRTEDGGYSVQLHSQVPFLKFDEQNDL